jgi:hypothetical protein
MQLLRVKQNESYRETTYRRKHITWDLSKEDAIWESVTTIDDRFLVPIPAAVELQEKSYTCG